MLIFGLRRARRDVLWMALATLSALATAAGCKSHHPASADAGDAGGDRAADGGGNTTGDAGPDAHGNPASDGGSSNPSDARADNRLPDGANSGGGASGSDGAAGGPSDDGGGPLGDGGFGAGCNTITLGAPVPFACATGDAGASTGGTIVPGTYQLTAATIYGPCVTGLSAAQTLVITATTVQTVAEDSIIGLQHLDATYTVAGTDMLQIGTCPNTDTRTVGFSATDTTLTVVTINQGSTTVGVLTRQ
jgi:hypothetical protein